jgi:hypothetical protein
MPFTKEKTWQYSVNNTVAALGAITTTHARLLRSIKNTLLAFGTLPWTVVGSSNSVAAGLDAVDRWAADGNLVWANEGNAHSWIVLKQTGIGSNFQLLINCSPADTWNRVVNVIASPNAGFTGGSTTARPTATDEVDLNVSNNEYWAGSHSADGQFVYHVMQSTDGQCTRILTARAGAVCGFWLLDKAKNPVTGWTYPFVGIVKGDTTGDVATIATLAATSAKFAGWGTAYMNMYATHEVANSNNIPTLSTVPNDLSTKYPVFPIGLLSETAGQRGRHGDLFDLWWGLTAVATGDFYPGDASKQFVQLGDVIFPWNGGAITLT